MDRKLIKYQIKHSEMNLDEVGYQLYTEKIIYEYTVFQNYVIHYIEEGYGKFEINNKTYSLGPNQGFILRKGNQVKYYPTDGHWKYYWLGLSGERFKKLIKRSTLESEMIFDYTPHSKVAGTMKEIIADSLSEQDRTNYDIWFFHKLYELLYYICLEFPQESINENSYVEQTYAEIAHDYISNNYSRDLQIAEIANYVGISRSYLYRLFKERYSISPQQYLMFKKMEQAKTLLTGTRIQIKEVAVAVGYTDQLLFSKNFKRIVGISPSNYRKNHSDNK